MIKKKIIIYNKKKKIIYEKKNLSLLKILIKNNVYVDYHCQEGYCGTCRIILIKGKIFYFKKNHPLAALKKNEITPCCCKILSNIIIKL
jgi:ferredoxin